MMVMGVTLTLIFREICGHPVGFLVPMLVQQQCCSIQQKSMSYLTVFLSYISGICTAATELHIV